MVMSDSKDVNRNGKKTNTSPLFSASNNLKQQTTDDLSSETSEEDESSEYRVDR
jgi:hypothetical protein